MFPGWPPLLRAVFRRGRGALLATVTLVLVLLIRRQGFIRLPDIIQGPVMGKLDPGRDHAPNKAVDVLPVPSPRNRRPVAPGTRSFAPGIPKAPGQRYTKALVMAKTRREDASWIHEPFQYSNDEEKGPLSVSDEWDLFLYTTDDTAEQFHTPMNKGREVMAYVTYIVDNYNRLPDVSVFMHAHRSSWHDNFFDLNAPSMLRRLNLDRVARQGYVNLRCQWSPGCPDHIHPADTELNERKPEQAAFAEAWRELFPLSRLPRVLSQPCCAQFALTADRIRALPLAQYVGLRDWVLKTDLEDSISGRVFEYIYQYLWTGQEVLCPAEHDCYCEGYGICFRSGKKGFDAYVANKFRRGKLNKMLDELTKAVRGALGIKDDVKPLEEPTFVFWDERGREKGKQSRDEDKPLQQPINGTEQPQHLDNSLR